MKLFAFFVTVLAVVTRGKGRITSIGSYSDDFSNLEFPDDRDECMDGMCSSSSLYNAEKRMMAPEKVIEHRQLKPRTYRENSFAGHRRTISGCMTETKIVDLGEGHYPRYITTGTCVSNMTANKFNQCRFYMYRIYVLVKRGLRGYFKNAKQLDFQEMEELTLPESLHTNWQLFGLFVPVACINVEGL